MDIYPTLVDYCQLPKNKQNEGNSLLPLLKDPKKKWEHVALTSYGKGNVSLRNYTHRYIQYEDGSEELYDMIHDPNEWNNIAEKKGSKMIKAEFDKHIPREQEPLSKVSYYTINEYWRTKVKESHQR